MKNTKHQGKNLNSLSKKEYSWTAAYEIGRTLTSNFNLEEVLSLIGKIACTVTKSDATSIILADTGTGNISIGGSFGINKKVLSKGPLRFERLVNDKLASTTKPLFIKDIKKSRFKYPALIAAEYFCSSLCVPAVFNRRFLASLILYNRLPHAFSEEHLKVSSALAYQIALAIQNYNLYTFVHMNYFDTIRALVLAMEARDPYTKGHSERVTQYALMIADSLDVSPEQTQMIKYCGRLHDIGKIAISDTILNKRGPLTKTERAQIQLHPGKGADMLMPLKFLERGIPLVRYHHERYDGSGYPDGLKGERIPLAARILACADAYDAMLSDRPYRPKLSFQQALGELQNNAGRQFDPEAVSSFIEILKSQ